jgi:hypothetical protein
MITNADYTRFLTSQVTSSDPDGMPPSGSLCVLRALRGVEMNCPHEHVTRSA